MRVPVIISSCSGQGTEEPSDSVFLHEHRIFKLARYYITDCESRTNLNILPTSLFPNKLQSERSLPGIFGS